MKSVIVSIVAAAGLMVAGAALADGAALVKSSGCMGCHKMEGKLVGPGFAEVAKKYKGDAGAAAHLETKIAKGGAGAWGTMPMPAMGSVKPADVKTMVTYILSLAK